MQRFQKYLPATARLFMGVIFTVLGLNGFFHFLPMPAPPPRATPFLMGLLGTGYFFPLLKGTEVIAGILLLSRRFVPLALAVLAPVLVNIVAFHLFMQPAGLALPLALLAAELYLARSYRAAFAPMLRWRQEAASTGAAVEDPAPVRHLGHAV